MQINHNMLSLLAFAGSLFFAGAFLNGERVKNNSYKQEIKSIEKAHEQLVARMDSIYKATLLHEQTILRRIDTAYMVLDRLSQQKQMTAQKIGILKTQIADNRAQIKNDIQTINRISKSGFIWKLDADNNTASNEK